MLVESDGTLEFRHEQEREPRLRGDDARAAAPAAPARRGGARHARPGRAAGRGDRAPPRARRRRRRGGRAPTASPATGRARCTRTPRRSATTAPRSPSGFPDPAVLHESIGDLQTLAGDYGGALASYQAAAALASPELAAGGRAPDRRPPPAPRRVGAGGGLARDRARRARRRGGRAGDRRPQPRRAPPRAARTRPRGSPPRRSRWPSRPATRARGRRRTTSSASSPRAAATATTPCATSSRRSRSPSRRSDPAAEAAALNNLALAVAAAGETERAIELTRAGLARAVELGDRHREAALRNRLADLLHAAGRDDEAMAELKAAVAIFAEVGEAGEARARDLEAQRVVSRPGARQPVRTRRGTRSSAAPTSGLPTWSWIWVCEPSGMSAGSPVQTFPFDDRGHVALSPGRPGRCSAAGPTP